MARIIEAFKQFFDGAGNPLINGKIRFVESGTNNTDKTTFKDVGLTIANTNPVLLDGEGKPEFDIFGTGVYKGILFTSDDVQVEQHDPIGGISDAGQFSDWVSEVIYDETDIVRGSDLNFYQSKDNNNQGNDPVTDAEVNWEQIDIDSTVRVDTTGFDLDWSDVEILKFTAVADFTITFSNIPTAGVVLVEIQGGGDFTATYPSAVVFDDGIEPLLATGTNTTVVQFYTSDAGTKIFTKSLYEVIA